MTSDNISVSVPREGFALRAAARLFEEIAAGLEGPVARGMISKEEAERQDAEAFARMFPTKEAATAHIEERVAADVAEIAKRIAPVDPAAAFAATPAAPAAPPVEDEETPPEPLPLPVPDTAVDADGLPWDGRIHGSGKAFLAKTGQWKKARGMAAKPEYVAQIEAEIRAAMAAASGDPLHPVVTSAPPVAPVKPAAPAKPALPDGPTFVGLMQLYQQSGIGMAAANAIAKEHGCGSLATVATKPEVIPAVYNAIKEAF